MKCAGIAVFKKGGWMYAAFKRFFVQIFCALQAFGAVPCTAHSARWDLAMRRFLFKKALDAFMTGLTPAPAGAAEDLQQSSNKGAHIT